MMDGCPKHGPKRPLNFLGYFDRSDMTFISASISGREVAFEVSDGINQSPEINHIFLLAHYPTTTVVFGESASGETWDALSRHISVYLSGHLHNLIFGTIFH